MKKILLSSWTINFVALFLILLSYQVLHYSVNEPLLFPSLTRIAVIGYELCQTKVFWSTFYFTFRTLITGWLLSVLCITIAVFICWRYNYIRKIFECYCGYFNGLPNFTLIPIMILLFGITNSVMLAIMVYSVFFIMSYQILGAFDTLAITWKKHVKNLNWGLFDSITKVYLPASAPILISMGSTSWTYMWRTLISLEVVFGNIGGYMGLGTYIVDVKNTMDIDKMYVVLFTIATTGFTINYIFEYLRKRSEY